MCFTDADAPCPAHGNFFHSVLGWLDVETKVHTHNLDIFAACRVGRLAGPAQ